MFLCRSNSFLLYCLLTISIIHLANGCMTSGDVADGGDGSGGGSSTTPSSGKSTTSNSNSDGSTVNTIDAQCKALAADFGSGDSGSYTIDGWNFQKAGKLFGNQDTGLTKGDSNKQQYMAVEMKPNGKTAVLTSAPFSSSTSKNLLIKYYEATAGIVLQACSNDLSHCKDVSNPAVSANDRKGFQTGNYQVTPDTKQVLLVAKNAGNNHGVVALDSIGISDSPDGANKCPNGDG